MAESNSTTQTPGTPPDLEILNREFQELVEVVAHLRSPDGCPWDQVQTLESIKPCTLEETYELLEAIDSGNDPHIVEELGDVLLQVVLDAQIGQDEQRFSLIDVVKVLKEKLIRRHPHVFGEEVLNTPDEVKQTWESIKRSEKKERISRLDGIPLELPALARAARLQEKAAKVGYDFPHRDMLFDKLKEEMGELQAELYPNGAVPDHPVDVEANHTPDCEIEDVKLRERVENEMGDVIFVLANIARRWKINPEQALRKTNAKFMRRFQAIERGMKQDNRSLEEATLAEMEEYYQAAKKAEKEGS